MAAAFALEAVADLVPFGGAAGRTFGGGGDAVPPGVPALGAGVGVDPPPVGKGVPAVGAFVGGTGFGTYPHASAVAAAEDPVPVGEYVLYRSTSGTGGFWVLGFPVRRTSVADPFG